ncbi:hypothetical protein LNP05_29510 [Klebsiella pneumoniae subsp. pneumoniae]|nr:hypothetical protein [Klebsiella pneumoniae subsp. pneumoniae]
MRRGVDSTGDGTAEVRHYHVASPPTRYSSLNLAMAVRVVHFAGAVMAWRQRRGEAQ